MSNDMETHIWESIRTWLNKAAYNDVIGLPPETMCRAIADDPANRGFLALLLNEVFAVPQPDPAITRQQCEDDLAAFIDLEGQSGTRTAAHEYPHVWWRLWLDLDFATAYRLVTQMHDAEQAGEMPAFELPLSTTPTQQQHVVTIQIQKQPDTTRTLHVMLTPPVRGKLIVRGSAVVQEALIDETGVAVLPQISEHLFTDQDTLDLVVHIESAARA
jgi:hypothetical protein